jgi:branched-chain amino acid transport system substrate-binding protein
LWFTPDRVRPEAVRIGRFHDGLFASAPTQIVPVINPDPRAIDSGAVFDLGEGDYGRLQSVVYTGIYVNEISRVDLAQSSFDADFYVWERFARLSAPDAADPTSLVFPNMVSGSFDRGNPTEQGQMPDGTDYRLWRVRGTFRNDFDLHCFPFDTQQVSLSLFNALAATDRIVYVLDRRSIDQIPGVDHATPAGRWPKIASPTAFRNLMQWIATEAQERREDLVTNSTLGDLRRVGAERYRELSGFIVTVSLQRRAMSTLVKSLLPLVLMTVIMFASLKFPHALVKEKITVAITAALSGAVLLTAINSQLGGVGYTIAVEYAFYVFFGLSVLCIVSVLFAERLRTAHRPQVAVRVERSTEVIFLVAVAATAAGAASLALLPN